MTIAVTYPILSQMRFSLSPRATMAVSILHDVQRTDSLGDSEKTSGLNIGSQPLGTAGCPSFGRGVPAADTLNLSALCERSTCWTVTPRRDIGFDAIRSPKLATSAR